MIDYKLLYVQFRSAKISPALPRKLLSAWALDKTKRLTDSSQDHFHFLFDHSGHLLSEKIIDALNGHIYIQRLLRFVNSLVS